MYIVSLFRSTSSCVPYVASFSGLSFFDCPFGIIIIIIIIIIITIIIIIIIVVVVVVVVVVLFCFHG